MSRGTQQPKAKGLDGQPLKTFYGGMQGMSLQDYAAGGQWGQSLGT